MMNATTPVRILSLLGAALLGAAPAVAQTILQGPIVNPANGHTYFLLSNSDWTAAEAAAVALGGHLVTINDAAEDTFVQTTFANATPSGRVWLGYTDAAIEGTFVWVSGELPGYTQWEAGEPNNVNNEDYTAMYANNGNWVDVMDLASPPLIGDIYGVVEVPVFTGNLATNATLGAGCYDGFASFYELFVAGAIDLGGSSITLTSTGNGGYVVLPAGSLNAVGSLAAPTALALGDDTSVAAGTLGLTVHSNGFISFGTGNGNGFTPTVATFLNDPAASIRAWHDFNPASAGSGLVQYEEAGTQAQITWDGVYDFGNTTPNTLQFQIDVATGEIVVAFGALSGLGNGFVVGYSPAGPSSDPGSVDLSTSLPVITQASDSTPLVLTASTRPVIGTNWNETIGNTAGGIPLHIVGLTDPGLADLFFLGLPGCGLRASLDLITVTLSGTVSLPIPNNATLVGAQLFTNAASLIPGINAFGAITSNGVVGTIGDV